MAGRELEALAATLPVAVAEAARKRGRGLDLWETAAGLLAELMATIVTDEGRASGGSG